MSDSVQQIKERLSIVDVVSTYVELQPAGKNMKGKCPFHNEKTPSFNISPDRNTYYCFGCSQGGDIFTFVETMEGVDFKGALKILAEKAGVELVPEDPKKKTARDRQYEVLETATEFFVGFLGRHKVAHDYLLDRGVKPETIAKWRIGYAPGPPDYGWRDGKEYLEGKGFSKEELSKAGLIKGFDTGKEPYDLFRDRVVFPIFDAAGKVVAYSGRLLTKDSEAPKYVNSPETELFNKSEILYGYDKAKQGIRSMDFSLIVEGQFDVVLTHQAGYTNTVAVSGTALTDYHVMLLQRLSNRVVLALDGDRAGIAAVKRAADLMLARGMDIKVAKLPDGEDPADIIGRDPAIFKSLIGSGTHVIEYLLDVLESQTTDDRTFKLKAREEILPYVVKIPNRIDQEHFEKIIADRLGTTKDAIRFEVERISENAAAAPVKANSFKPAKEVEPNTETIPVASRQKAVLQHLLILATVVPEKLGKAIDECLQGQDIKVEEIRAGLPADVLSKTTFEIESQLNAIPAKQLQDDIVHQLNEYQELTLKELLREQQVLLKEAELAQDEASSAEVLQVISKLQAKLRESKITIAIFTD